MLLLNAVTLPELMAGGLRRFSDNIAVEYGDQKFTYQYIEKLSQGFCRYYQSHGLKKGDHIGILSDVTPMAIGAMLGALSAGLIYIPINIHAPNAWVSDLIISAELKHIMVQNKYREILDSPGDNAFVTLLDNFSAQDNSLTTTLYEKNLSDNVAYILYTSGSTG